MVRTFLLIRELHLPRPIDVIFPFFADALNLQALTPPWMNFTVQTPSPIIMRVGLRVDYGLRVHRIPIRWQSEITAWDPPHRFVDEQRRGPYRKWIHEHTFEAVDGGTLVRDRVQYAVPGGWLVQKLLVGPDLERIFNYRHHQLLERFG